jgi:transposase
MSISTPNQYPIFLSGEQRERLEEICRNGHSPAKKIRHAQVLLLSDRNRPEGRMTGNQICEMLGMHLNTVARIRRRFVLDGEIPALNRKVPEKPPTPPIIDGEIEPQLVAICCSKPPAGRVRWTLQMLADALMERRIVTRISAETVRRVLKKTSCSPGGSSAGVFPNGIEPDLSPKWRRSSTPTPQNTQTMSR